jgi:hypothetical protein
MSEFDMRSSDPEARALTASDIPAENGEGGQVNGKTAEGKKVWTVQEKAEQSGPNEYLTAGAKMRISGAMGGGLETVAQPQEKTER